MSSLWNIKVRQQLEDGDDDFLVFSLVIEEKDAGEDDQIIRPCAERMQLETSGSYREYFLTFKVSPTLSKPEQYLHYKLGSIWAGADDMIASVEEC